MENKESKRSGRLFGDVTRLHFLEMNQSLSSFGIGKGQPPILRYLTEHDGCIQTDIAKEEKKAPATITVMLKTMEKNGLIERRSDKEDLRTMRIFITDKGREACKNVKNVFEKMDDEVFSVFSDEEYEEFNYLLGKMKGRLEDLLGMERTV